MLSSRCPACRSDAVRLVRNLRRDGQLARCAQCGHLRLLGCPTRPDHDDYASLDSDSYQRSMEPERRGSAKEVIQALQRLGATGPLLDVGCSYGWLLTSARAAGFESYGVEPSPSVVTVAQKAGLAVRPGHFPEEHWSRADWGVISFLDVLEHIEDIETVLSAVVELLRPGGHLVIQVPVTDGPVFGTARLIELLSGGHWDGPLRRMLQMEFASPHVHYFSRRSLGALLDRFGFELAAESHLPIAQHNLADRVSWSHDITIGQRVQAMGLRVLVESGRMLGRHDLLQVVARWISTRSTIAR
jgi:SAM-dependent methyltransferase